MQEGSEENLTPISNLGEFQFIDLITKDFKPEGSTTVKAVGDDAAIYSINEKDVHILTFWVARLPNITAPSINFSAMA